MSEAAQLDRTAAAKTPAPRQRLESIDLLRGLVIVIMVLDHVREFFHPTGMTRDPTDLAHTTPALFFTRWITHLCAPTFVFLAGASAYLQKSAGRSKAELSRFLLTRGLWLIFLEVTVVGLGFNFGPGLLLQVIWAIGGGFILLAGLIWLPRAAVIGVGLAIVIGHGALTPHAAPIAALKPLWAMVLWPGSMGIGPGYVTYPVIPWLGVMCLGYGLGPMFRLPAGARRSRLLMLGLGCVALAVVARLIPALGDAAPAAPGDALYQAMSFVNVQKYPPSLPFVLLMLGLAFLLLLAMERLRGAAAAVLLAFGRVPLFAYVLHLFVAHGLALLVGVAMGFPAGIFLDMRDDPSRAVAAGWGFGLPGVYLAWVATLAIIYLPARWFSELKRRRRDWWLSYL
jgi:uncharacterized membrane protein